MELQKVGENTYYFKNPTNIGVFKIDEDSVLLIDSGNDKDAGRKILKILESEGLTVAGILSTHSNADHVGGNKLIQNRTGCPIYTSKIERAFTENPILEPSFLYGGYPFRELKNKFLMASESIAKPLEELDIPGIEYFPLKGHFFEMVGFKTSDDVYFLGDSLFSEETISKYHLFFIYDVKGYLDTLDYLASLEGKLFIPSHCEATHDISDLILLNRKEIERISEDIVSICEEGSTFEKILKSLFDRYGITMNEGQYVLIGSTIRSYLSYLYEEGKLSYSFDENEMIWKAL